MGFGSKNLPKLLSTQLQSFMDLCHCDGGAIYTMRKKSNGDSVLVFETMITRSRRVYQVPTDLRDHTFEINEDTLVGKTAFHRQFYKRTEPRPSSEMTDYWVGSILSAPLITPRGDLVGVVQLLNKLSPQTPPEKIGGDAPSPENSEAITFDARDEQLLSIVAGQAALAIENSLLLEEQEKLLEGFVNACVTAVEARDPVTSGHSNRVADYSVALSESISRTGSGPLALVRFSDLQLRELRFAAMLHDIGKISVRESVLNKEKKLLPEQAQMIQMRLKLMRASLRLANLEQGRNIQRELQQIEHAWKFIAEANEPKIMATPVLKSAIDDLCHLSVQTDDGELLHALTEEEGYRLSITRGSLTKEERIEVEKHVTHTYEILKLVPWSRGLERVPEIAYKHHEKLDGTGYPAKIPHNDIPIQSRILTICDIFDALTADDRPYKASVPLDKALDILASEVSAKKIDGAVYSVFLDARIYEQVVSRKRKKAA